MPAASKYRIDLGANIREKREQADFTQEALAEKALTTANYLSRIERGVETVSMPALLRIAEVLGVDVSDLLIGVKADKTCWHHRISSTAASIARRKKSERRLKP